jgi:hypothetical protein
VNQPQTADVLPVFHSTDPIEASAVAAALQAKGIPAIVIEDIRDIPFDHASWAAAVASSVPTIGSRPSAVVVPSSHQHAAIEGIRAFGPYRLSSAAHSAGMNGPIEGFGLQPTPTQRLIAWIVLVPTVIAVVVAAVRALRHLLR